MLRSGRKLKTRSVILYQRGCASDKQHLNDNDNVDTGSVKCFNGRHPRLRNKVKGLV